MAQELNTDLVEVAPQADPPVCRLMDFGKFQYERAKKEREARKAQKEVEIKEIRLRPKTGEHDIAEGCGTLTVNYHSPSGAHNFGTIPGTWSNAFHVYGMHRMASSVDVYYDGQKVKSYPTDDNGKPHSLILDLTEGCGGTPLYGAGSEVLIDYVRAWE